ncbi:hypothetical protein J6590_070430 [Homalodisca vitripennis]|nr:hypothetical protein J6590_070430 [Homalodisca vitripennis]
MHILDSAVGCWRFYSGEKKRKPFHSSICRPCRISHTLGQWANSFFLQRPTMLYFLYQQSVDSTQKQSKLQNV